MAPVWCPKNFFWSIWKGGRYQLWTPNCSNPEVAHNKSMNMEITSLCNTVCPTFWLLKIPPLRYILIHFFDYFFNCKLFLLINSSYYKANTWLKNCVFISHVWQPKDSIPFRSDLGLFLKLWFYSLWGQDYLSPTFSY